MSKRKTKPPSGKRISKWGNSLTNIQKGVQKVQNYAPQLETAAGAVAQQTGYLPQAPPMPPPIRPYRGYQMPMYREPPMPPQVGAGYREPEYPPPNKPLLGPLEKKLLIYATIFVLGLIVIIIVMRALTSEVNGYFHTSSGCHFKKNNHCGSGKKHQCNSGSHTKNSGHNSCGGS